MIHIATSPLRCPPAFRTGRAWWWRGMAPGRGAPLSTFVLPGLNEMAP
ncbi:hypothetical protein NON00_18575 [Roseomonas sp. GC11]|nr:hypothetical protein [Roseomonas sp. GC11]MCQ4161924.1 hypothetical protein [Roseomonas sp. GC11]